MNEITTVDKNEITDIEVKVEISGIKTCVVYNKLCTDSLLAAAILKAEFPTYEVVDIGQLVTNEYETYVWLGIPYCTYKNTVFKYLKDKEHIVFMADDRRLATINGKESKEPLAKDAIEDCASPATLISKICQYFRLDEPQYFKLGFHLTRFYGARTEAEYLALIHYATINAWSSLFYGNPFRIPADGLRLVNSYIKDRESLKFMIRNSFRSTAVSDGDRVVQVFHTTMDTVDYHLILRMIRLTHKNYLNTRYGLNGTVVQTSLNNPKLEPAANDNPIVL